MIEINNKRLCESCFAEIGEELCTECGFDPAEYAPDPMVLPMGTKLADKIIIGRVMGKGGFGVTYLGYDTRMEKPIAVKEYYPNGMVYRSPGTADVFINDSRSAEAFEKGAEKFYTEAKMVAQFNGNPNIVSVYDYFKANNTVYLIMEYLKGITLKKYLKKHGKLSDGQALYIMDKIAAALSITHSAGVLHRDISPDNIMICKDGKVKLIDFGAARQIMAESSSNLTVVMKPGYTPIEQYTKKGKQGAWTDIYSLGVSVYYALTDIIIDDPYARMENDEEMESNIHGINNDLWNVLKKCTMLNSSDRYGSAIDLRKALRQVSEPVKAEAVVISDSDLKISRDSGAVSENSETTGRIASFSRTSENRHEEEVIEVFDNIKTETAEDNSHIINPEPKADPVKAAAVVLEKNTAPHKDKTGKGKKTVAAIAGTAAAAGLICLAAFVIKDNAPEPAVSDEVVSEESSETTYKTTSPFTGTVSVTHEEMESTVTKQYSEGAVRIDDSNMLWSMDKSISKETLDLFDGDILVTLELKETNTRKADDGNYYHGVNVLGNRGDVQVLTPNTSVDEYNTIGVIDGQNEIVFVLTRSEADKITEKMYFEVNNTRIISVTLEDYSEPDFTKTVELDSEYQGDWRDSSFIPKSELESYNGDVLICLDVELTEPKNKRFDDIAYIKPVDENIKDISVYAYNFVTSGDNYYRVYYSQPCEYQFYFIIGKDDIDALTESGLRFRTCGAYAKAAHITAYNSSGTLTSSASIKTSHTDGNAAKPLTLNISGDYEGDWLHCRPIMKNELRDFKNDIKVTLNIEILDKNDWTAMTIQDNSRFNVKIDTYNTGSDSKYMYHPFREQTEFTFVIPKNVFRDIDSLIQINSYNVDIKNASVENYDPESDNTESDAKVIELDGKYPGSWVASTHIPKEELQSFGGDVRVTLNIEQVRDTVMEGSQDDYWVQISPEGSAVNQHGRVKIQADQVYPCQWADWMYVLYDNNVPDKFTFVISQSEIDDLYDDGLFFRGDNFFARSAVLEKA